MSRLREKQTLPIVISSTETDTSEEEIIEYEDKNQLTRIDKSDESTTTDTEELEDSQQRKEENSQPRKEEDSQPRKEEEDNKLIISDITEEHKLLEEITSVADNKTQSKEYFVTFNNFNDEKLNMFKDYVRNTNDLITCVCCAEFAPTTNHLHYHAYLLYTKRKWRKNLNAKFHGDWRKVVTTPAHCYDYIYKYGNIIIIKNDDWLSKLSTELRKLKEKNKNAIISGYWKKGEYKLVYKTNKKGEKQKKLYNLKERTTRRSGGGVYKLRRKQ